MLNPAVSLQDYWTHQHTVQLTTNHIFYPVIVKDISELRCIYHKTLVFQIDSKIIFFFFFLKLLVEYPFLSLTSSFPCNAPSSSPCIHPQAHKEAEDEIIQTEWLY
ncbi:hypothetical protein GOODEAATRI_008723 [Goodea atripinnis]|uniref:Uncharacterized protein n=1 Tax=Goodea atripinnis TaxID=208336 RepID=A0ABV0PWH6_9TELE